MSDAPLGTISKPLFDPSAFLAKPAAGVTLERFLAGWQICVQGEPADTVGYIRKGRVKVTTFSNRGKEAIVGIIQKGQFFNEACLGCAKTRTATVVAMEDCLITSVTRDAMLSKFNAEPQFAAFFMAHLVSRNSRLEEDLGDQLLNLSERRLARLLLLLANAGQEGGGRSEVNLSQEALAEMVGTTRSRISTFMNKFREQGFISYDSRGRKIEVYAALLMSVLGV